MAASTFGLVMAALGIAAGVLVIFGFGAAAMAGKDEE